MQILSHRGYWRKNEEKNRPVAFQRSFGMGFGTELDVRDYCGKLVVSHDIADSKAIGLKDVLGTYSKYDNNLYLAINIKADGLQNSLFSLIRKYKIVNYFVFDMSVPDMLEYLKLGVKVFARESELEKSPLFYEKVYGVWMDELKASWISARKIKRHIDNGKKVCVVSPELHQRNHMTKWKQYRKDFQHLDKSKLMLCTDFPEEARRYFND
jgi:glycerophosphoryl diester phosphodiesterase